MMTLSEENEEPRWWKMVMEYEGGMEIKMLLEREEDSEIGVRKREILKKEEEWEEDREILSECE